MAERHFWLVSDHVVHPTIMKHPKIVALVNEVKKAKDFKMTEYQGMNYTIMHTEFVRERAERGMLILGSNSHTCSAGAVGCLFIELGTADVTTALSTGETWFKVPESILINFVGALAFGMSGKDVEASVAVYPNPDGVVPVSEKAGMHLDGVFIGACTTTEEELVLTALVLKVGLQKKLPIAKGKKHYILGSLLVVEKWRELGLLEVYEEAGFTRRPLLRGDVG